MDRFPYRNKLTTRRTRFKRIDYTEEDNSIKPRGLWYSIRKQWYNYSKAHLSNAHYKYVYEFTFHRDALTSIHNPDPNKVLRINTLSDLLTFKRLYFKKVETYDWTRLKNSFAGLEIVNYKNLMRQLRSIDSIRLSDFVVFVSALDVSCGVLWNIEVIDEIKEHLL